MKCARCSAADTASSCFLAIADDHGAGDGIARLYSAVGVACERRIRGRCVLLRVSRPWARFAVLPLVALATACGGSSTAGNETATARDPDDPTYGIRSVRSAERFLADLYGMPGASCILATNEDFVCRQTSETGSKKIFCLPRGTEALEHQGTWFTGEGSAIYGGNWDPGQDDSQDFSEGAFEPEYCTDRG